MEPSQLSWSASSARAEATRPLKSLPFDSRLPCSNASGRALY